MSSFATAATRAPDKESRSGKQQIQMLLNPEAPPEHDPEQGESAANRTQTVDEINRVDRLLSQLEARSMALVPYGYGTLREVPARQSKTGLLAGSLVAIWLTTLILSVAYIRFANHAPTAAERTVATAPLLIPSEPDPQEQRVASSVDHLAKALVSSSERMNQLQAAVERSNRDWQRIATKVGNERSVTSSAVAKPQRSNSSPATPTPEAGLPRNWHRVLEVKPTEAAVPHKGLDGAIDYWLVARAPDQSPSKVLPIGTSAEGVIVHNLDDGKDYTLTPSGEWRNGALMSTPNN